MREYPGELAQGMMDLFGGQSVEAEAAATVLSDTLLAWIRANTTPKEK